MEVFRWILLLREDARQRCLEEARHILGLLPSLVEHKGAVGRKEEGEGKEDASTSRVGRLLAVAPGGEALSRDVFRQRSLRTGQGKSAEGRRLHVRLGHELHTLIHVGVIGVIVAVKVGAVFIDSIVIVVIIVAVPVLAVVGAVHGIIVVAVADILQIMRQAGLADPPGIEGRVPRGEGFVQGRVHGSVVVAVVTGAATAPEEEVAQEVLHLITACVVLDALGVGVQSDVEVAVGLGLEVVVQRVARLVLPGVVAALRPRLARALHKAVLLGRPDAGALVLEELLHVVVVPGVLEEAQEGEVGVVEVAVHLGAAGHAVLGVLAGSFVPSLVGAVPVLVLSESATLVLQVDVLR